MQVRAVFVYCGDEHVYFRTDRWSVGIVAAVSSHSGLELIEGWLCSPGIFTLGPLSRILVPYHHLPRC